MKNQGGDTVTLFLVGKICAASFAFVAAIIGAGIFGLPYAVAQAGYFFGEISIVLFAGLFILLYVMYCEIMLRTEEEHNIAGYARVYLGVRGETIGAILTFCWLYGMLFVYTILGAEFIQGLLASYSWHIGVHWARGIMWTLLVLATRMGTRLIAKLESILFFFFTLSLLLLAGIGIPYINTKHFFFFHPGNILDTWGVLVFTFFGFSAPLLAKRILKGEERYLKHAAILGTIISAAFFIIFTTVMVGITGNDTQPDALAGLRRVPQDVIQLGEAMTISRVFRMACALFFGEIATIILIERFIRFTGVFTISDATIVYSENLRSFYEDDCHLNWSVSFPTIALLFAGVVFIPVDSFLTAMKIVGSAVQGAIILLILLIWHRARKQGTRSPEYQINIPTWCVIALAIFFAVGSLVSLWLTVASLL